MDPCEQNTDKIIDALTGNLPDAERRRLEQHTATCARCGREREAFETVWRTMAEIPAGATPSPASSAAPHPRRTRVPLAAAASLLVGLVGGYLAGGFTRAAPDAPVTAAEDGAYLLLLRQSGPALGPDVPPEEQLVREYGLWARRLAERDALLLGERLDDDDLRFLSATGPNDASTRERAPHVSGLFLVRAPSFEEAMDVARSIPHLTYGGSVEVREVVRE